MEYSSHATRRMLRRGISQEDVEAVLQAPTKTAPGHDGNINHYGIGPSGYRIRVTVSPNGLRVVTICWADQRKKRRF